MSCPRKRKDRGKNAEDIVCPVRNGGICDNHAIAYCMLGYLCAYYRHYHPLEFLTSFLNNAANDGDIRTGSEFASKVGLRVTLPKWGVSGNDFSFDAERKLITKGVSSVKYMGSDTAEQLLSLAAAGKYDYFMDVLWDVTRKTTVDTRQLDTLIKIDFFSEFGNQRELLRITDMYFGIFKRGDVKKISREKIDDTPLRDIVSRYSDCVTKSGAASKSYTIVDVRSVLRDTETFIKDLHMKDLTDMMKVQNYKDAMGYLAYVTGKEEDRPKLYVLDLRPLKRKRDGKQFGFSVVTKSIGSGKESRFTVMNPVFAAEPIAKDDMILCDSFVREGPYFKMTAYHRIFE